jgi:hypothetical protein
MLEVINEAREWPFPDLYSHYERYFEFCGVKPVAYDIVAIM